MRAAVLALSIVVPALAGHAHVAAAQEFTVTIKNHKFEPTELRVPAGKRVTAPVSLLDLFPTFAEVAGAKVETPLDGHSLLPLISGKDDGREREVSLGRRRPF